MAKAYRDPMPEPPPIRLHLTQDEAIALIHAIDSTDYTVPSMAPGDGRYLPAIAEELNLYVSMKRYHRNGARP
jgi:hypothetical protein